MAATLHDIYFSAEITNKQYSEILTEIREHCTKHHAAVLTESDIQKAAKQLHEIIEQYIAEHQYGLEGTTRQQLVTKLYDDMAGYSFIKSWIYKPLIEELNINAWNDIEVIYSGGRSEKIPEKFESPGHAIDVIRRMLNSCGMIIDDTMPSVLGYLDKNIRIEVDKTPIVDKDVGVSASIRIVHSDTVSKQSLINSGTATSEMLELLEYCLRYKVSVCFAGATGSGKTTLMGWLLSTVPDNLRLLTIEDGSRELNLVRLDEKGNILNSVTHMLTRPHNNPTLNIDQDFLLERLLRKNPKVIGMGEIRGAECMSVSEAARTGIAVTTTIHSNSAVDTYTRMLTLAKRKNDIGDALLMKIMTEAFPIVVYTEQKEDGSRKITEICEAEKTDGTDVVGRTLYRYEVTSNTVDGNGSVHIQGQHRRVNRISPSLAAQLISKGMPNDKLKPYLQEVSS